MKAQRKAAKIFMGTHSVFAYDLVTAPCREATSGGYAGPSVMRLRFRTGCIRRLRGMYSKPGCFRKAAASGEVIFGRGYGLGEE